MKKFSFFTKKPITEDVLIHFSESPVSDFSEGIFKVKTQGRVYCMRLKGNLFDNPTTNSRAKSAIVFKGEAARKFKPHDLRTAFFFKRLFGQMVTTKIGDIEWPACTVAHDVIEVSDFSFVKISDAERQRKIVCRIKIVQYIDIACFSFFSILGALILCVKTGLDKILMQLPFFNYIFEKGNQLAGFIVQYWMEGVLVALSIIIAFFLLGKVCERNNRVAPGIAAGLKEFGYLGDEGGLS